MNDGIKDLIEGIKFYVDNRIDNAPKDITITGQIVSIHQIQGIHGLEYTYDVRVNNVLYKGIRAVGGTCLGNQSVRVVIPESQYSNMFILATSKQGGTAGVTSVNGETGDVILDIPNKTSQLTNDSGFITSIPLEYVTDTEMIDYAQPKGNYASNNVVTTTENGLMSFQDKNKLNGVEDGANKTIVDDVLSSISLNPVQNKVIDSVLKNIISNLFFHTNDKNNPHNVTKVQVGLENVDNVTTNNQTPTWTISSVLTNIVSGETLSVIFGKIEMAISNLFSHTNDKNNPHNVTKVQVGLENVDNTSDINKPISNLVQDVLNTKLSLSGGVMNGNISMNSNYINDVAPAINANQAVTFKQLNDAISGIGTVFDLKGSKLTVSDLPSTGNKIGDVWYVESESVGYIWLQDSKGILKWEKFGQEIDLSGYLTKTDLLQTVGQITDNTMSQKAITDQLSLKTNKTDLVTTTTNGLMISQDKVKLNGIQNGAQVNSVLGVKGSSESIYRIGNISLSKSDIGLGNVDNTSDINKPISNLVQTELNKKANSATLAKVATSGSYNDLVNKPTIPNKTSQLTNDNNFVSDANYVHTDNNFTSGYLNKLNGIQNGAEVNVNSDWNATSGDAFILNKPTSLPASGGNADTLDGLNSTDFARKRSISLAELNNPNLNSGIYNIQDVSLAPVGLPNSFAHVFVGGEYTGGGFGSQIAIPYYGGQMLGVWYRTAAGANYPVFRRIDDYNNIINKPFIPSVENTLTSSSTINALSANMGKEIHNYQKNFVNKNLNVFGKIGWFRLFTNSFPSGSFLLNIERVNNTATGGESYSLLLNLADLHGAQKSCNINQLSSNVFNQILKKIRVLTNPNSYNQPMYVDIYYNLNNNNQIYTSLFSSLVQGNIVMSPTSQSSFAEIPQGYVSEEFVLTNNQMIVDNIVADTTNSKATFTELGFSNINSGEVFSTIFGKIKKAITELISHILNKSNPHGVIKEQVGLGNVDNTADRNKSVNYANTSNIANNLLNFSNSNITNIGLDTTNINGIGYIKENLPFGQSDGSLFKQCYSSAWKGEIYVDYRSGQIATRSKNNGTWQPWRLQIDNLNYQTYITKSGIGIGNVANERQYSANNPQVNISGTANSANRLNIIDGNEVVFGNGFVGGEMQVNYKGSSAPITRYVFYNGASNHGLAKIRAAEFVGNLDGTAIAATNVNGGYVYSNSIGNDYSLLQVGGGTFVTGQSNFTGYLKITLPVSWTNTLIKMEINIYDYQVQGASTYYVGGYNYNNNARWYSTFAYSIGGYSSGRTVRFGHDGSKCCIYIGEANTVWNYPQISINNVLTGHSGANYQTWNKNWQIGFTTSLGTITSTESGELLVPKSIKSIGDEDGNNIKKSYGSYLTVNGQTVSLMSKSGQKLSSITVQTGVITWQ
ncbi:MAG: pyocin knob domain-containing protein [Malacoplasma sp.]